MSLLTIIQQAAGRIGLTVPVSVVGNSDSQVTQLLALANEEGEELSIGASVGLAYDWQALQTEANFTAVATESQGAITTIAPGFKYIINGTIFNRTLRRPVPGPLPPQSWQMLKAANVIGPYPQFRIRGGNLILLPTPNAGDTIYFEYQSQNWCQSNASVGQTAWAADTDTGLLDEQLMTAGVIWRWKKAKNLEYAEDFRQYQTRVITAISRDGGKTTINIGDQEFVPGVLIVPESFPSLVGH